MALPRKSAGAALAICCALTLAAPASADRDEGLRWSDCGDGFQCATATVPKDYGRPRDGTLDIAVIRKPATDTKHRIGSLFVNYGGPGGDGVDYAQTPRGRAVRHAQRALRHRRLRSARHGPEPAAIDCKANQETDGIYSSRSRRRVDIDVRAFAAQGRSATSRLPNAEPRHPARTSRPPTSRATWTGCARPSATRSSPTSASPTARSSARRTGACSRNRYRALVLDGAVDADAVHQRPGATT